MENGLLTTNISAPEMVSVKILKLYYITLHTYFTNFLSVADVASTVGSGATENLDVSKSNVI